MRDGVALGVGVAQRHVLDLHFAPHAAEDRLPLVALERRVERVEDALGRDVHHHEGGVQTRQVPQGRHDEEKRREERHEVAHRDEARLRLIHRCRQHDRHARHAEELRERSPQRGDLRHAHGEVPEPHVERIEAADLLVVGVRHLDHALGLIGLLHAHEDFGDRVLARAHHRLEAPGDVPEEPGDARTDQERDQCKGPVVPEEHHCQGDHLDGVADQRDRRLRRASEGVVRLEDELRRDDARLVLLVLLGGPAQDFVEHLPTQVDQHRLGDLAEKIVAHEHAPAVQERDEDEARGGGEHHPGLLVVEARVGELAQKGRDERGGGTGGQHEADGAGELALVGGKHGREAPQARREFFTELGEEFHSAVVRWRCRDADGTRRGPALPYIRTRPSGGAFGRKQPSVPSIARKGKDLRPKSSRNGRLPASERRGLPLEEARRFSWERASPGRAVLHLRPMLGGGIIKDN